MIQRIQSVFLLLALIAQSIFVALPLAHFVLDPNIVYDFYPTGFKSTDGLMMVGTAPLLILSLAIPGLILTTLFLYKKRILQIRVCIYTILLNIGMVGMLVFQIFNFSKNNTVISHTYTLSMVIPVVSVILLFLAFRGIRKDEVLVKAYERLR